MSNTTTVALAAMAMLISFSLGAVADQSVRGYIKQNGELTSRPPCAVARTAISLTTTQARAITIPIPGSRGTNRMSSPTRQFTVSAIATRMITIRISA